MFALPLHAFRIGRFHGRLFACQLPPGLPPNYLVLADISRDKELRRLSKTSIKSHVIVSGATGRYVSQPFSKPPPSATRPQLREGGYARRGGGSGRFGLRRGHLVASLPEARPMRQMCVRGGAHEAHLVDRRRQRGRNSVAPHGNIFPLAACLDVCGLRFG